ncbi:aspartate-semialdehyde dehydrogenase [Finegoldia magna ACS-171-V-Col3]|uniref:aspartate-semialdehyde dehydrogenase n=1 Tax=Finegoldia magna TaxID=1260 RepID=UPI0001DE5190|nr:aspartate-semialdehyde dehydrogenase [Finegoldia magna]EFK94198.1 aspartate-semialdehyde dehydrogenase [Finegoldia magna ACS-171-V-Col3]
MKVNVAVVGATGLVGSMMLKVLSEKNFPIDKLYLFSSKKSAGSEVEYCGKKYTVEELNENSFEGKDIKIALFSAGGSVSEKYAPIAAKKGVTVIDNSSHFRMNPDVPLVVPEINPEDIKTNKGIIANPNCSTIQSVLPLKPIHDKYKIKRVIYSTYQSVSGSGVKGISDLEEGTQLAYKYPIRNNCIPQIDAFMDNGYTKEEMKMIDETKKILHDDIRVTATTVRVPVKTSHSVSINVETEKPFEIEDVKKIIADYPGMDLQDDIENEIYPMAITSAGKNEVFVGRIRRDFTVDNGLNLWCCADNIRKGAATNAVQIALKILEG